jgi:CBS-domain-containing membrane protein
MSRKWSAILDCWGTRTKFSLPAYLWFLGMLGVLVFLDKNRVGFFLVPAFLSTLSIIHLLPEHPISQPYAVIVGSVLGSGVGAFMAELGRGPMLAAGAAAIAFVAMHLLRAYHPPGVALALYSALLHPGAWFPLLVVLPFSVLAVGSAALFSRMSSRWPRYPVPLPSAVPLQPPGGARSQPDGKHPARISER